MSNYNGSLALEELEDLELNLEDLLSLQHLPKSNVSNQKQPARRAAEIQGNLIISF